MADAWSIILYALDGVIDIFTTLFNAFALGDVVFPILFITTVFALFISPFVYKGRRPSKEGGRGKAHNTGVKE